MIPKPGRKAPARWDLATAALILGVLAGQALFAVLDLRMPRDPGLYYKLLPALYQALEHPIEQADAIAGALVQSSGWYNLLLAAGMHVLGRGPLVMELAMGLWVGLLLLGTGLLARGVGGPSAGFNAVALGASMPLVLVMGRTPWIHIPEAALAVLVLVAWHRDPALQRWRTVISLGLGGALAITLRHSGLVWIAPLAPLLLWTDGRPRAWRRIPLVILCWALALVVPIIELQRYLEAKMGARERYVSQLPQLLEQAVSNLSWPTLWICGLGLALLILRRPRWPRQPLAPLLVLWLLLAGIMWVMFRAGLDNFTPAAPALAVLAGLGLARLGAWGAAPALLCFIVTTLPQWLPHSAVQPFMRVPGFPDFTAGTHPNNHYRPWDGFAWAQVGGLLEATCGPALGEPSGVEPGQGCVIAVDHGLFSPFTEDPGKLELFLMGADEVHLISLRDLQEMPKLAQLQALATYDCLEREEHWRERYPLTRQVLADMLDGYDLHPVWKEELSPACYYLWMTPEGALLDEAALPQTGLRVHEDRPPPRREGGVSTQGEYRGLPPLEGDAPLPEGVIP